MSACTARLWLLIRVAHNMLLPPAFPAAHPTKTQTQTSQTHNHTKTTQLNNNNHDCRHWAGLYNKTVPARGEPFPLTGCVFGCLVGNDTYTALQQEWATAFGWAGKCFSKERDADGVPKRFGTMLGHDYMVPTGKTQAERVSYYTGAGDYIFTGKGSYLEKSRYDGRGAWQFQDDRPRIESLMAGGWRTFHTLAQAFADGVTDEFRPLGNGESFGRQGEGGWRRGGEVDGREKEEAGGRGAGRKGDKRQQLAAKSNDDKPPRLHTDKTPTPPCPPSSTTTTQQQTTPTAPRRRARQDVLHAADLPRARLDRHRLLPALPGLHQGRQGAVAPGAARRAAHRRGAQVVVMSGGAAVHSIDRQRDNVIGTAVQACAPHTHTHPHILRTHIENTEEEPGAQQGAESNRRMRGRRARARTQHFFEFLPQHIHTQQRAAPSPASLA